MTRALWLVAVMAAGQATAGGGDDIVLENTRFRAVLGADAAWRSLVDKATRTDYAARGARTSFALARVGGRDRSAEAASMSDGKLVVGFAGCDTRLTYAVESRGDWVMFRLVGVRAAPKRP